MFSFNKTTEWLKAKTEEKEKQLLEQSRRQVARMQREFIERQKLKLLKERLQKEEAARKKRLNAKIQQANSILFWGLMQTEDQVEKGLEGMSKSEQTDCLKAQLRFRKNVLEQKSTDSKIFNFSVQDSDKTRRQLTVSELKDNVLKLIVDTEGWRKMKNQLKGTDWLTKK